MCGRAFRAGIAHEPLAVLVVAVGLLGAGAPPALFPVALAAFACSPS